MRNGRSARWVILLLWLAVLAASAAIVAGSRFSTDMSAFLPSDAEARQQLLIEQIESGALSRLLLLGIEGGDAEQRGHASRALAAALRSDPGFVSVLNGDAASAERDQAFLFDHRYALSAGVTAHGFSAAGLHQSISRSVQELGGSAGMALKAIFPRDPTGELLYLLDRLGDEAGPAVQSGVWASADGERAVLMALLAAPGLDMDGQERALQRLDESFEVARAGAPLRLLPAGAPVFSVQARQSIRSQVERLSLIAGLSIALLMLVFYRSLRNVFIGLLPVASGVLVAIAAVALSFDVVHAVTIGFGTALMGETIDYSIYYLVQAGQGTLWRRHFWPTIRLGLMTSICGFASLLASSFPGLAQLGVYAIVGLLTAASVTRFVLPVLPTRPVPPGRLLWLGRRMRALHGVLHRLRWPLALLVVAALLLVLLRHQHLWATGLAGLNPASASQLALDAQLRQQSQAPDLDYMIVVPAPTRDTALAAAGQAGEVLAPWLQSGAVQRLDSPALFLPDPATQARRREVLPDRQQLATRLHEALAGLPVSAEKLAPFADDIERARTAPAITADTLQGTSFEFVVQTLLVPSSQGWAALMPLRLPAGATVQQVASLQQGVDAALQGQPTLAQAFFLDLNGQAADMFDNYLRQALRLTLLGALAIVILLALHLRQPQRLARILAPLAGALLLVMAGHALAGTQLTLLHLVGLLLVVAVGSNYALFFDRKRTAGLAGAAAGAGGAHPSGVWMAALALANLSTIIGFGILAWADAPVLRAIGTTVGPGAVLALLLAMAWSGGDPGDGAPGTESSPGPAPA